MFQKISIGLFIADLGLVKYRTVPETLIFQEVMYLTRKRTAIYYTAHLLLRFAIYSDSHSDEV